MTEMANNISKIIQRAFAPRAQFGDVVYGPGGFCGPRLQVGYQLVLLLSGEALLHLDDRNCYLAPGRVALLKPGHREFFEFMKGGETHHSWCTVDPEVIPSDLRKRLDDALPFDLPISGTMEKLIAIGLGVGDAAGDSPFLYQLAVTAFHAFVHEAAGGGIPLPEPVRRVLEIIERHYAEPLTVAGVAREAGVSVNHLIKLFRRHCGETPAEYLWNLRVDRGLRLLQETGLGVGEIAYRTGFQNQFHFSRRVRKRHGLPPRSLRERWWRRNKTRQSTP